SVEDQDSKDPFNLGGRRRVPDRFAVDDHDLVEVLRTRHWLSGSAVSVRRQHPGNSAPEGSLADFASESATIPSRDLADCLSAVRLSDLRKQVALVRLRHLGRSEHCGLQGLTKQVRRAELSFVELG